MRYFISLFFLGFISGCATLSPQGEWKAVEQNNKVVWADDGSEVAIAVLRYEEREPGLGEGTTEKRHFTHQVYLQTPNHSDRKELTKSRELQNGNLYYMKSSGFLLVELILENGLRRFDKVDLEGNWITLIEETSNKQYQSCESQDSKETAPVKRVYYNIIPSPDGKLLAHIYSPECGKITVQFEYANNSHYIDSHTLDMDQLYIPTWHPDGYIILAGSEGKTAWKVGIQDSPVLIPYPRCTFPETTSSVVSSAGTMIYFDESGKLITQELGKQNAFGCQ